MTPLPQHNLRPSERPVRSDYALERSYARRRLMTLGVMIFIAVAVGYALWGRSPSGPADIPTITAETSYKEKPADPGGIDIPHQDVQVYDELEGKGSPQPQIEHLLPPPEVPQDVPHVAPPAPPPVATLAPAPQPAPVAPIQTAPTPAKNDPLAALIAPTAVATTVTPKAAPAPVVATEAPQSLTPQPAAPATPMTIDQIIAATKNPAPPSPPPAAGAVAIQLASSPDKTAAQSMLATLQTKFAAQLGGAHLHLAEGQVPGRGTFYRIQSAGMGEDAATRLCAAIKQANAGCILVRK